VKIPFYEHPLHLQADEVLCDRTMTTAPKALAITAQLLLSKGAGDDAKTLLELIPTLDDTELAGVA